jgi:cytochrome c-type biogenesis protein CcmH/NrfG
MEQEILRELVTIKTLLVWLIILVSIYLISMIIKKLASIYSNWRSYRRKAIGDISADLFDREKYEEIIKYLSPKLSKQPNNADNLYWLGRANLELGNHKESKALFIKLRNVEPSWEEDYIEPYIKRIEENH